MDRPLGRSFATRSVVLARRGLAATSQPLATQVAVDLLRCGGTAVDAAIGANALLCLVEPTGAGLGGDLFALVYDAGTRQVTAYNGSGRSPKDLDREALIERGLERIPSRGPLPITVPGCVDGWFALHERHGRLPLAEVLAPAIEYCREGFPVSPIVALEWSANAAVLGEYESFRQQFLPGGRAPRVGELFQNRNLADTLEQLARGGRDAFYRGEIAERIERFLEREGGFLSVEDLRDHRGEWTVPLSSSYRGHEVWQVGPNTQGLAALQMLNVLERYELGRYSFDDPRLLHLLVEAKKLAYEDRARWYADPDFCDIPVHELVSKDYAARRAEQLSEEHAALSYDAGNPALDHGDTVYLCTADGEGNCVSLIQSNFRGMGSGLAPDGLGFVLQNRGELFDLKPGRFNTYERGKRPFHTIMPGLVTRAGVPWMVFGVMGGAMQPQGQVQILVNRIDLGMDLQEAGDAPRFMHTGSSDPTGGRMKDGGRVLLESGFRFETVRGLQERGHRVGWARGVYGGYQALGFDPASRVWSGASDARKDGQAAGY
jgi:gamma-glutamyltranspeptidase/glutathione hydrolase